jgi:hypothetical protein
LFVVVVMMMLRALLFANGFQRHAHVAFGELLSRYTQNRHRSAVVLKPPSPPATSLLGRYHAKSSSFRIFSTHSNYRWQYRTQAEFLMSCLMGYVKDCGNETECFDLSWGLV